jgi:hypothetical protein
MHLIFNMLQTFILILHQSVWQTHSQMHLIFNMLQTFILILHQSVWQTHSQMHLNFLYFSSPINFMSSIFLLCDIL